MKCAGISLATWARLAFFAALGCQSNGRKAPYSDNPLLLSREPIVHNPSKSPAATAAAPVINKPRSLNDSIDMPKMLPTPASLAVESKSAVKAPPASADDLVTVASSEPKMAEPTLPKPAMPSVSPSPRLPQLPRIPQGDSGAQSSKVQRFGAAPDYSWIQGEFDCHYRGHKELRFRSMSEDDPIGGKVRLVDDERLSAYQSGDVLRIEGELIRDSEIPGAYPKYVVKNIILVKTGSR